MDLSATKIALFGAGGMLASDVIPLLQQRKSSLSLFDLKGGERYGASVTACDLRNQPEVREALDTASPQVIINLAAYTAVDAAEKDYQGAFAVNGMGPAFLARWAEQHHAVLLHVSTDYVFGGDPDLESRKTPISEEEVTKPCGIYGESKRMGEELVRALLPSMSLIIRTSWLHGLGGPNFVDTIRRVLQERARASDTTPLRVVNDQFGSPTWCSWLSAVLVELLERNARGVFHASSRGDISWYDFARGIARLEKSSIAVQPQSSAELNRPAPRPPYSTLCVKKLESFLGRPCPSWEHGLEEHLAARGRAAHG